MVIWVPPATYHTPRHGRCEHAVEGDVPAESVEHPRPGREPSDGPAGPGRVEARSEVGGGGRRHVGHVLTDVVQGPLVPVQVVGHHPQVGERLGMVAGEGVLAGLGAAALGGVALGVAASQAAGLDEVQRREAAGAAPERLPEPRRRRDELLGVRRRCDRPLEDRRGVGLPLRPEHAGRADADVGRELAEHGVEVRQRQREPVGAAPRAGTLRARAPASPRSRPRSTGRRRGTGRACRPGPAPPGGRGGRGRRASARRKGRAQDRAAAGPRPRPSPAGRTRREGRTGASMARTFTPH